MKSADYFCSNAIDTDKRTDRLNDRQTAMIDRIEYYIGQSCLIYKPGSRHPLPVCHLAIGRRTIRQRLFDCKYLSCKLCFNVLNYVFIYF